MMHFYLLECVNVSMEFVYFVIQEAEKGVKEPTLVVYEDEDFNSVVSFSSSDGNSESAESRESRGRVFLERSGMLG